MKFDKKKKFHLLVIVSFLIVISFWGNAFASVIFQDRNNNERNISYNPELMPPNPNTYPSAYDKGTDLVSRESITPVKILTSKRSFASKSQLAPPSNGRTEKILIIPIEFTNVKFDASHNNAYYQDKANKLKDYYEKNSQYSAASHGITIDTTVADPVSSVNAMEYYGTDGSDIDNDNGDISELAREAVLLLDARGFDFSTFDTDFDGNIDHIIIVHAGAGQEEVDNTNLIWSHNFAISGDGQQVDEKNALNYSAIPENVVLGTIAHEFGHDLGLPDLYDTDDISNGVTYGVGAWDIMGTGSWNSIPGEEPGSCPANLSAWSKVYLGWTTPTEITTDKSDTLSDIDGNSTVLRVWPNGDQSSNEYFLVEYRRKANYDAGLPGEGVLVWHIDSEQINASISNNLVNAYEGRLGVELEQADGKYDLWYVTNSGDAGDPFPGTSENTNFIAVPYGLNYSNITPGGATYVEIRNIAVGGSVATLDIHVTSGAPDTAPALNSPSNNSLVDIQPNFDWSVVSLAKQYKLQIADDNGFTTNVKEILLSNNLTYEGGRYSHKLSTSEKLDYEKTYYWRIAGVNELSTDGNMVWSDVQKYSTVNSVNNVYDTTFIPSNIQPSASSDSMTLTWDAVSGATGYYVLGDGVETYVITNSYTHSGLTANARHKYQVRAVNDTSTSDWSQKVVTYTTGAPIITTDATTIAEGSEHIGKIVVSVANGTFRSDGIYNRATVMIDANDLPQGVRQGVITRMDANTLEINLVGDSTADYDTNKAVTVMVAKEEIDTARYTSPTADAVFTAIVEATPGTPNVTFSFDGDGAGKLMGITTDMEYSLDGGSIYTTASQNDLALTPAQIASISAVKDIKARVKATLRALASSVQTIDILAGSISPNITVDKLTIIVSGIDDTMEFSTDGTNWIKFNDNLPVLTRDIILRIRKSASGLTLVGEVTTISFIRQAPSVTFSFDGINVGKLMGSTTDMEYSLDGGQNYSSISANDYALTQNEISGISPVNDINVRLKATEDESASYAVNLDIQAGATAPNISANDSLNTISGINDTIEFSVDGVNWTKYNNNLPDLSGNLTLRARFAATGMTLQSDITTLTFTVTFVFFGGGGGGATIILPPTPVNPANDEIDQPKTPVDNSENANQDINTQINDPSKKDVITSISEDAKEKAVVIDIDAFNQLTEKGKKLTIKSEVVEIKLPPAVIDTQVLKNAGKDAQVKVALNVVPSEQVKAKLAFAPQENSKSLILVGNSAFEFKAEIVSKDNTKSIHEFNSYVTVIISLKGVDLKNVNVDKLGVYYYDETKKEWQYVGGNFDKKSQRISFSTSHFSLYTVMQYNKTFSDIQKHWAKVDIEAMAAKYIAQGKNEDEFDPDTTITRAEFTALLVRALGLKNNTKGQMPFEDIKNDSWYTSEMGSAFKAGIISKVDGVSFRPDINITREEMVALIMRALKVKGKEVKLTDNQVNEKLKKYSDNGEITDNAKVAFAVAIQKRIIQGRTATTLEPRGNATRAEAIVILRRLLKTVNL